MIMIPQVLEISARDGAVWLPVHVQPGASRDRVRGVFGGALGLAVKAPPVDGAANDRCRRFLARHVLHCAVSQVVLDKGARARGKRFRIEHLPVDLVRQRVAECLAAWGIDAEVVVIE